MTIEFQENDKMRIGFGRRTHYTGTIAAGVTDIAGITGTGKILFEDGDVYIGGIVDGLMHDKKGEYQQSSRKGGVRFIGSYKNGLREGRGTCYFSNGSKLETEWTAGKPVNSGTFCYEGHKNYTITWKP